MKFLRPLLFLSALVLSACVGPDGLPFPPAPPPLPPLPLLPGQQRPYQPESRDYSDYQPELRNEYRSGYDIGARDAQYGYPRDYRHAYRQFGNGYESYFQEGYADGYDRRGMRH